MGTPSHNLSLLLPSSSTLDSARVRKNTMLSPPALLQSLHSGAGDAGNEVNIICAGVTGKCGYTHDCM